PGPAHPRPGRGQPDGPAHRAARRADRMITRYVWRDLVRNPRRSLATLAGITLGVGLFSAVLFFIDGSSASMTQRAIAPLPLDMQRILTDPLGEEVRLTERITPGGGLRPGGTRGGGAIRA